jgi:hypothetical protein
VPTPFQHLVYADRVLNHPDVPMQLRELLTQELGAFLLGTTAGDVQVMTGQRREETHFYRLSDGRDAAPVDKMLSVYPELAHAGTLSSAHAAFITGYLVHLAWDELWAWDVFVPFYRDARQWLDATGARDRALFVHHNALRVWLDRTAYADLQGNMAIPDLLEATVSDHWLPFAPDWALNQWRDWLVEQLRDSTLIQTAEVFAERLQVPLVYLEDIVDEMASGAYRTVPGIEAALAAYEAAALTASVRTVLQYWGIEHRLNRVPAVEPVGSVVSGV